MKFGCVVFWVWLCRVLWNLDCEVFGICFECNRFFEWSFCIGDIM